MEVTQEDLEKYMEIEKKLSELEEPIWAVIKFDGAKAKGLTYKEAIEVLGDEADGDLCIVTAEAAARMGKDGR